MMQITNTLAEYIRKNHPEVKIDMTGRFKSKSRRKKYYIEETDKNFSVINEYRAKFEKIIK